MQSTGSATVLGGRYALEEPLGRSTTGMVWLATDTLLGRRVSVKLVHPRLADDPAFAAALDAEVRRVAALTDPRLARLLDSGAERDVSFLVREYVEGRSLRALLDEEGSLGVDEALAIVASVLLGLGAMHGTGVHHLALDAGDVIVAADGSARVTDLGIGAAIATAFPSRAREFLGPERLAPEQLAGRPAGERTDVFAVGALAFEALTGEPPRGRTSVRQLRGQVPRPVDRAIAKALDPDPAERFGEAAAFLHDLVPEGAPVEHLTPTEPPKAAGFLAWIGVPLVIAGVAAALIAIGLWIGSLEVGGPLGIRPARESPEPAVVTLTAVRPVSAVAIDPFGDDTELSSHALRAVDGDPTTLWRSEDYFDGTLGKPGIGLVLDLGTSRRIVGLRLWTPHPGYTFEVAVGDDPDALVADVGDAIVAEPLTRITMDATGRYVLVWFTSVVPTGDGNRAEVAEVRLVVPTVEGLDA